MTESTGFEDTGLDDPSVQYIEPTRDNPAGTDDGSSPSFFSDSEKEGAWHVGSELLDEGLHHLTGLPGVGTALGALSLESDESPDQREARETGEENEELGAAVNDDRNQQLSESLSPIKAMDAPAEPEQDTYGPESPESE